MRDPENMQVSRRVILTFPASLAGKPVTYRLVKDYGLVMNILRANARRGHIHSERLTGTGRERETPVINDVGIRREYRTVVVRRKNRVCDNSVARLN